MPKKLILVVAVLALSLAIPTTAVGARRVQTPSEWNWSDVIDSSDLAALNTANSQWQLWDFNTSTSTTLTGLSISMDWAYQAVSDSEGHFLGYDLTKFGRVLQVSLNSRQLTGSIPSTLGNLSKLTMLELDSNQLTGTIPASLGNLSQLTVLELSNNQLTGTIPASLGNLSQLTWLSLHRNQLTGTIPDSLGNLSLLTQLYLSSNKLSGVIPSTLGSLSKLTVLWLNNNQLTGQIPSTLGSLSQLTVLGLNNNQLTGQIPSTLGNLSQLTRLYLYENQLTGTIPATLGNLSQLTELYLGGNQLTGTIPDSLGNLSQLTVLDLGSNQLTGTIPASLGNLSQLTGLYLGSNQLTGTIPDSLGNLSQLTQLTLFSNQLTGTIPASLGNLSQLTWLNLSDNELTGEIPQELVSFMILEYLGIQHNCLTIDTDGQKVLDQILARGAIVEALPQKKTTVTLHRAEAGVLSNGTSAARIHEPLEIKPITTDLESSTTAEIDGGLVCDGATPLLFKVKADGVVRATTWAVTVSVKSGGTVTGGIGRHVFGLEDGTWRAANATSTLKLTIPAPDEGETTSESYGYISAINAEDLTLRGGHTATVEITAQLLDADQQPIGTPEKTTFGLRKPPVVLVHGYNSNNATWSTAFLTEIYGTRSLDFVVPVAYGVDGDPVDNTTGRFDQLALNLDGKLTAQIEGKDANCWPDWAWTRYDAVGHSQGGVLLRMLCTRWPLASFSATGFRSAGNFYRGRFNRIITIGSPHNGSVILHAFIKMGYDKIPLPEVQRLLQKKFDPFVSVNDQIAEINHPAYQIDPGARFHLIRSTIPEPFKMNYNLLSIYNLLHYGEVTAGSSPATVGAVLLGGRGSDGIVDFDSQGAGAGTPSSYDSTVPLSHADPGFLFGVSPGATQTASAAMGRRVIGLLDQGVGPSAFGPFVLPTPLSSQRQSQIDAALPAAVVAGTVSTASSTIGASERVSFAGMAAPSATSSYRFSLTPDASNPLQGEVKWSASVFGPNGITSDGVTVQVNPSDTTQVTVMVDSTVKGDVVLYSSYLSTTGKLVFSPPALVVSQAPGANLLSLSMEPNAGSLQPGGTLPTQIWGTYDNGSTAQLFLPVSETSPFSFTTTDPNVASVDNNGLVTAVGQGSALINVTYQGLSANLTVTVNAGVPAITLQPADSMVAVGGEANFTVAATGAGLTYQWYLDGNPIMGATTATLSLSNAQSSQKGGYSVAVQNNGGTALSETANLSFLPGTNANLSALTLSSGTLNPAFASGTTNYTASVANAVSSITVTPTLADPNASVQARVNGGTYASMKSGNASRSLAINVGSNTVDFKVTAEDGVTTKTYSITVARASISLQQPAGVALSTGVSLVDFGGAKALPGISRVFTVKNSGSANLSSLAVVFSGADAGDFSLSAAPLASLAGGKSTSFTVVFKPGSTGIKNALLHLTSSDTVMPSFEVALTGTGTSAPAFTVNPASQLVAAGSAASFTGSASGGAVAYQWLKNGLNISGATAAAYNIAPVTLASASGYSLKAVNASGSVISAVAQLGVVDTTAKTFKLGTAATVSFTITTAGNGLTYAWKKDGSDLPVDARITGVTTKVLTIKNLAASDAGVYTCVVTGPGGTLSGGANTLVVFSQKPEILTPVVMPDAIVSGSYTFPIPVNGSADLTPTSYAATGLPTGLTCNATTGVISGKPTVSKATPYAVTLKASNAKGSTTATSTLRVHALPANLTGTFNGLVDRSTELSGPSVGSALQGHGGRLSNLVITSTGNFTGTLLLEEKSYAIPGGSRLDAELDADATATVKLLRGTATDSIPDLTLQFTINKDTGELTGTLSDGGAGLPIDLHGWRQAAPTSGRTGAYTAALDIQDQVLVGDIAYPQGNGYLTMSVSAAGVVTWGGKLADGTAITGSSAVAAGGDIPFHQLLYSTTSAATAGSAHGWVKISDDAAPTVNGGKALLDGTIDWLKKAQATSSTTRSYKQGFPLHNLLVGGGRYVAPAAGEVMLGLVDGGVGTTNASLKFTEGGLTGPAPIVGAAMALDLETVPVRITSRNAVVMPTGGDNPATVTLAITASSGLMSGSFTLKNDPDPTDTTAPIALLTRKASYAGVLVPRLGKGIGQFQLAELPSEQGAVKTTLNTSPIWSGQVIIE